MGVKESWQIIISDFRPSRLFLYFITFIGIMLCSYNNISLFYFLSEFFSVGVLVGVSIYLIAQYNTNDVDGVYLMAFGVGFSAILKTFHIVSYLDLLYKEPRIEKAVQFHAAGNILLYVTLLTGLLLMEKRIYKSVVISFISILTYGISFIIIHSDIYLFTRPSDGQWSISFYFFRFVIAVLIILIFFKVLKETLLFDIRSKLFLSASLILLLICDFPYVYNIHGDAIIYTIQTAKMIAFQYLYIALNDLGFRHSSLRYTRRFTNIRGKDPKQINSNNMTLQDMETCLNFSRELMRQAVANDKQKSEFVSSLTHEFKTPLNVILSTIQLMNSLQKSSKTLDIAVQSKYFNIMRQNCFRLLKMVNNLIDINRIDSEFYKINLQNADIVRIVEDITLSVAEYVKNKKIEMIFDTEIEEKDIACDPYQIERILLNLLSNAIKFTPEGGTIRVDLKLPENNVCVSVTDTGKGISKEKLGVIFQRYGQAGEAIAIEQKGSGIGLSLVKLLLDKLNGSISVESELNKGSKFTFYLPDYVLEDKTGELSSYVSQASGNIESIDVEFSDIYY